MAGRRPPDNLDILNRNARRARRVYSSFATCFSSTFKMKSPRPHTHEPLGFFFFRALAWAMFDSAKKRNVAAPLGLTPSVSNFSAVAATFFAKRRNRLRSFLL